MQNDRLGIERAGGDLVFFPAGVPSAKIAFARTAGKVTQLTLVDPTVLVTAKRE